MNKPLVGDVHFVCNARLHCHPDVRLELTVAVQLLLSKCRRSAVMWRPKLLETLFILTEDESEVVKKVANTALDRVSAIFYSEEQTDLTLVVENSFYGAIFSLFGCWNLKDSRIQKSFMSLLLAHLRLLGDRLGDILLVSNQLNQFIVALVQGVALNPSSVVIIEDTTPMNEIEELIVEPTYRPWLQFFNFANLKIVNQIALVCQYLGKYCDLTLVTTKLLEHFEMKKVIKAEYAVILNFLLGTSYPDKEEEQFNAIRTVVEAYLDPNVWQVPLFIDDDSSPEAVPLVKVKRNIIQACILTEGVAVLTSVAGPQARQLLPKVMYPVLERSGSALEFVSYAGREGLKILTECMGYDRPEELIKNEAQYFVNDLKEQLKTPCTRKQRSVACSKRGSNSWSQRNPSFFGNYHERCTGKKC